MKQNIYSLRPNELKDNTHLFHFGAFSFAGLAIEGMKEKEIPKTKYFVPELIDTKILQ